MKKLLIFLFVLLSTSVFAQPIKRGTISGGWYVLENKTKGKILWITDSLLVTGILKASGGIVGFGDSTWRYAQVDTLYGLKSKTGSIRIGAKKLVGDSCQFNKYVGLSPDTARFLNSKNLLGGKNVDSLVFGPNSKIYRVGTGGKRIVVNSDTFSVEYFICDSIFANSLRASKIYGDSIIFNAKTKVYSRGDTVNVDSLASRYAKLTRARIDTADFGAKAKISAKGDSVYIDTFKVMSSREIKTTIDSLFVTYVKCPNPITPTIMFSSLCRFGQGIALDSISSLTWTVVVKDSFKVLGTMKVNKKLYVDTVYCFSGDTLFIKSNTKFLRNIYLDSVLIISCSAKLDSLRSFTAGGSIYYKSRGIHSQKETFNDSLLIDSLYSELGKLRLAMMDSIVAKVKAHFDSSIYALSLTLRDSIMVNFMRSLSGNLQIGSACSVFVFGQWYVLPNLDTTTVLGSSSSRFRSLKVGPNGTTVFNNAATDSISFQFKEGGGRDTCFITTGDSVITRFTNRFQARGVRWYSIVPTKIDSVFGNAFMSAADSSIYTTGRKNDASADSTWKWLDLHP